MVHTVIITLAEGADAKELADAKKQILAQGGKITHEYTLIKGFAAELPDSLLTTLVSNTSINVEEDQVVTTQVRP